MKLLQRSLVARIIASLLAISGMALISITLTMAMSNSSVAMLPRLMSLAHYA